VGCLPPYVFAVVHAVEVDFSNGFIGFSQSFVEGRSGGGNTQNSAAASYDEITEFLGSGVQYFDTGLCFGRGDSTYLLVYL
jgi:aryl-alcohol dehydrogenase-like predicted oxidoreductase